MVNVLPLFATFFIVFIVGGGLGYLIWVKTRPKKQSWIARCYQLSEGIRPRIKDEDGNILLDVDLNDLKPYTMDTIVKIQNKTKTIHKLSRQQITTDPISADHVEVWGDKKEVNVLIIEDTAFILKKGLHKDTGNIIFSPMPRNKVDLITSEIMIKQERNRNEKNLLQAITPWIVAGIVIFGLIGVTYFISDTLLKINKENTESLKEMTEVNSKANIEASRNYLEAVKLTTQKLEEKEKTLGEQPTT